MKFVEAFIWVFMTVAIVIIMAIAVKHSAHELCVATRSELACSIEKFNK